MREDKNNKLDPDVRFLLANERTLLAWIRTSLGLLAGGVALTQLQVTESHKTYGLLIVIFGAAIAVTGYHRFIVANKAIRSNELPPVGWGPAIQVLGVVVIAVLLAIAQLFFM
jgi:putative membrane protein